jgi:hypothetical protein
MVGVLDVQRDHAWMILKVMDLLAEDGLLIFSTNYRRFELDENVLKHNHVVDISDETLDKDFGRNKKIHRCWEIRKYKPEVENKSAFYDAEYATSAPASLAAVRSEARQAVEAEDRLVFQAEMRQTIKAEAEARVLESAELEVPTESAAPIPEIKVKASFNPWLKKD